MNDVVTSVGAVSPDNTPLNITVKPIKGGETPHHHKPTNQYTRTFVLTYNGLIDKQNAKEVHIDICHAIPRHIPGATVRQIPRAEPTLEMFVHLAEGSSSLEEKKEACQYQDVSVQQIEKVATTHSPSCSLEVKLVNKKPYRLPTSKRCVRIFRIKYLDLTRSKAQEMHLSICDAVARAIPGVTVRLERE